MILLIDNYDSFTYNLFQAFAMIDTSVEVYRNDDPVLDKVEKLAASALVISPGPGGPLGAGLSSQVIVKMGGRIPVLGVCLGHQCVAAAFGAQVVRAPVLMHGKTSLIQHSGQGVFRGLPTPFEAVRYHSLVVDRSSLPSCLEITAEAEDGTVMGLRHRDLPVEGVQFHPESILTVEGPKLLRNFLESRK